MHCPECNYPLWNLAARQCPECGAGFKPSDFEFVVNSVVFCCPHCDQRYYGTGALGHLQPTEFVCSSCGNEISMDEMVLRPAEGVQERQTKVDRIPWLERDDLGWFKAWFTTIGLAMVAPHRLIRGAPSEDGAGGWLFALLTWAIFTLLGLAVPVFGLAVILAVNGDNDAIKVVVTGIATSVCGLILALVYILVWGAIAHGLLKLTGGAGTRLGRTYDALCYSSGSCVMFAVPCIGPYCGSWIAAIWWIVSAVIMVIAAHRVHGGRATFAVLTFPVLTAMAGVGGYFSWLILFLPTLIGMPAQAATAELEPLVQAVTDYAAQHEGEPPRHALELVEATDVTLGDFVSSRSATALDAVPIGDETAESVELMPENRRAAAIAAVVDAVPDDVVAHRFGDFIFTGRGVDLDTADPGLWIILRWPDPEAGNPATPGVLAVMHADGTTEALTAPDMAALLAEQNALRAEAGLPPLPDPGTITHAAPARAP